MAAASGVGAGCQTREESIYPLTQRDLVVRSCVVARLLEITILSYGESGTQLGFLSPFSYAGLPNSISSFQPRQN